VLALPAKSPPTLVVPAPNTQVMFAAELGSCLKRKNRTKTMANQGAEGHEASGEKEKIEKLLPKYHKS
jgi:hypothetical protein